MDHPPIAANGPDKCPQALITGPPGVGKSLYMAEQINRQLDHFTLVVRLDPSKIGDYLQDSTRNSVWQALVRSISLTPDYGERCKGIMKWDALLIAFVASHRPVLIVLNDLHVTRQTTTDALSSIREHFQKFYRWGNHISVVCTTRETDPDLPDHLRRETSIIKLRPMDQLPAQELFWKLSTSLSVPVDELKAQSALLQTAFAAPALRVPLFISICAYLIAPRHRKPVAIANVLNMTATQLLEAFVTILCERGFTGNNGAATYGDVNRVGNFQALVSHFAHELWPRWNNMEIDDLEKALRSALDGGQNPGGHFNVSSLVKNGFLVQEFSTTKKLGFPHQAVSDYLTACHMAHASSFQKLEDFHNPLRTQSVREFLLDLVENAEQLELLFFRDPATAVAVSTSPSFLGIGKAPDPAKVGKNVARWALTDAPYSLDAAVWSGVRMVFDGVDNARWLQSMMKEIRDNALGTAEDIALLVGVGYAETLEIVEGWLAESHRKEMFTLAAGNADVRRSLGEIAQRRGIREPIGLAAFRLLWRRALKYGSIGSGGEPMDEVVEYLKQVWRGRRGSELKDLYRNRDFSDKVLEWIGLLARNEHISMKQAFSETCAKDLGHVLVCAGNYQVKADGKSTEEVEISRPLWVPCLVDQKNTKYDSYKSAMNTLRKHGRDLMRIDEARVVLTHFSHQETNRAGVMFKQPSNEAFISDVSEVAIYGITSSARGNSGLTLYSAAQFSPSPSPTATPINVGFRRIKRL